MACSKIIFFFWKKNIFGPSDEKSKNVQCIKSEFKYFAIVSDWTWSLKKYFYTKNIP